MRDFLAFVSVLGFASGCGGSDIAADVDSTTLPPPPAATAVPASITSSTGGSPTTTAVAAKSYTVVAGDTLYGIARQHCTTLDEVARANGWTDGADHAIYPDDTVLVPDVPCTAPSAAATSSSATTSTAPGGHVVMSDTYVLWGDPADYGAVYASPACTELRDAGNGLASEPAWDEDGDLGSEPQSLAIRFLAAIAAMPDPPPSDVASAIVVAVDVYTRNRPVYAKIQWDMWNNGIDHKDNPAWPGLWSDISSSEADLATMWNYVHEQCPAIENSED